MRNSIKFYIVSTLLILLSSNTQLSAQDLIEKSLHTSGKIYLVVGTLVAIFIGVVVYLFSIDKNISKIEKHIKRNG